MKLMVKPMRPHLSSYSPEPPARFRLWIWDFLGWALVIFPIVTGGIWVKRPGLKIELAELAVPVLILLFITWFFGTPLFKGEFDFRKTSSFRFLNSVYGFFYRSYIKNPTRVMSGLFLGFGFIWAWGSLNRHWAFGSGAADLGIFTSAIWNLTHGYGYHSSLKEGMNLFADHQSPIFLLFAPFFAVFPKPETLLILQALALSAGGLALHALVRQTLPRGHWARPVLPLLYWAYLPLRNAVGFDFHPETLMLPLFLAAIAGLQSTQRKNNWAGAFAFLLALGCKESAGPVAVGIGAAWALSPTHHKKWALPAIASGILVFVFDTHFVPRILGIEYPYHAQYAQFGDSTIDLLLSPILNPSLFWGTLFSVTRIKFLIWTLGPLAFLPLLNPRTLIAAAPGYLMIFLSAGDHRVNPIFHYAIEPAVGLFFALPGALLVAERWYRKTHPGLSQQTARPIGLWILICALLFYGRPDLFRIRYNTATAQQKWVRTEALPCIREGLDAAAAGALVPHLVNRNWIHHFPRYHRDDRPVSCAVDENSVNHWPANGEEIHTFDSEMTRAGFTLRYQCGAYRVFQNKNSPQDCMACMPPPCPEGNPIDYGSKTQTLDL